MTEICIKSLLEKTSKSLDMSFKKHDPCNNSDKKDPKERNLSLHIAHAMLSDGFAVFGEADFPLEILKTLKREKGETWNGVDVLGISPDSKWFLACEFKQIYGLNSKLTEKLRGMLRDIKRLEKFRLRKDFPIGRYDDGVYHTARNCEYAWGLVGGLYFVKANENPPLLGFWKDRGEQEADRVPRGNKLAEMLNRLKAEWLVLPVHTYPTGNRYHMLAAFFRICGH